MYEKFDQSLANVIHIYPNMDKMQAKLTLLDKAKKAEKENLVDQQRLWLLRDSSVAGLISFDSIVYHKATNQWLDRDSTRYMYSSQQDWVINNKGYPSPAFDDIVKKSGGREEITSANKSACIKKLGEKILKEKNCRMEDRISPFAEKTLVSLHDYIANILICPLIKEERETKKLHGAMPLMKHPVVWKGDGQTYERDVLVAQYKGFGIDLKEGIDYYNNFVLKSIISSIPPQEASPTESLKMLAEIDEEILIDPLNLEHFNQTVVSPSGFSFSEGTITQYIHSKKIGMMEPIVADPLTPDVKIGRMDLIPNKNLELFVKLWPDFYKTMDSQMELK